MCLAIAGRILSVEPGTEFSRPAQVILGGTTPAAVDLVMVPEAGPGDYVLVHSGYALSTVTPAEAARIAQLMKET